MSLMNRVSKILFISFLTFFFGYMFGYNFICTFVVHSQTFKGGFNHNYKVVITDKYLDTKNHTFPKLEAVIIEGEKKNLIFKPWSDSRFYPFTEIGDTIIVDKQRVSVRVKGSAIDTTLYYYTEPTSFDNLLNSIQDLFQR